MTDPFTMHTKDSAPGAARPLLEHAEQTFGMIPNLQKVMAGAPPLLDGYFKLWSLFEKTSLTPAEQQVVLMTSNFENACDYCVAWHSILAEKAGLPADEVQRLREGAALADPKLAALQAFARTLIYTRGNPHRADLEAFTAAGYKPEQALEVVLGLAMKVLSNYTNGIAGTPLDEAAQERAWTNPTLRSGAGQTARL